MILDFKYGEDLYYYSEAEIIKDGVYKLNTDKKSYEIVLKPTIQILDIVNVLKNNFNNLQYQRDRKVEYDKLNQDELRYNDLVNGTNTWIEAIQEIKSKIPKLE